MKDIEDIAKEKYPSTIYSAEGIPFDDTICEIKREAFISGSQYGKEWISVETLPEPSKEKKWQIYSPTTLGVADGYYWGDEYSNAAKFCNGWSMAGVTHYKELPEPPKS